MVLSLGRSAAANPLMMDGLTAKVRGLGSLRIPLMDQKLFDYEI
jgi:hypothetical protein